MDMCIFTTRLKECCKEKGYTQDKLAEKINISVNGLKRYFRTKNDRLPPLDLLKRIADVLDVDVAYLLGEIDCKKYSQQTIYDVLSLDAKASEILGDLHKLLISVLNDLIKHPRFDAMLFYILQYVNSHNKEIIISDLINPEDKESIYSGHKHQEMLKFSVTDAFSQIIDDIYEEKRPSAEKAQLYYLQKEMLTQVQKHKNSGLIQHPEAREIIEKIIINMQKQMELIDKDYLLVKLSPEMIITHIDLLVSQLLS